MIKRAVKRILYMFGFELKRGKYIEEKTMQGALYRQKINGRIINTVIDVGASNGSWSLLCKKYFPSARYLLIEAQAIYEKSLRKLKDLHNFDSVMKAAGNRQGKIFFDNAKLLGGVASEKKLRNSCIEVPVTTIDHEIKNRKLPQPYLIKMDTHGFEVPILEGAIKTLRETALLIIETYNFKINENSLKYYELCVYMEKKGFLPVDMADPMPRKKDHFLWQMDTFFIQACSKEFKQNSYE